MSAASTIEITDRYGATLLVATNPIGEISASVVSSDNPVRPAGTVELDETDRGRLRDFLAVNS